MTVGTNRVFALVFAAVLALAGCGHAGTRHTESSASTTTPDGALRRPDSPPDPQTLLQAGATALAQVPAGTLIFIESQTDDNGTWKVRVASEAGDEQQVKVGPDGITVLVAPTAEIDGAGDKAARRTLLQGATLDYQAAVPKMLAAVPDGSITRLSLADVAGTVVWKAIVWDTYLVAHQVSVNAASGDLLANTQV